ncbi:MAG: hypothetical protein WCL54_02795 [Clostridia bacterium]
MKSRVLAVVLIFVIASSFFAGCQFKEYPNVPYFKVADTFNADGWKPFVMIQIKEKRIAVVSFDAVNINAKTTLLEADANGEAAKYKVDPAYAVQLRKCAQALIEKQDVTLITFDAQGVPTNIPGVSAAVKDYFDMAKSAIDSGAWSGASFLTAEGATSQEAASFDKDGWKRVIDVYVKGYVAIAVSFDAVNQKGEYRKALNAPADKSWIAQNKLVEEAFIKEQSQFPTFVNLAKDGTTKAIPGVTMNIKDVTDLLITSLL